MLPSAIKAAELSALMNARQLAYKETFGAWSAGKYAYALELSRVLLQKFPGWNVGLFLRGCILADLARYEEAEQTLNEAVDGLSGEHKDFGYTQLANLNRQRGNFEIAEKWYRKAIEVNPDKACRHILLGAVLAEKGDLVGAEAAHRQAIRCASDDLDEAYMNLGLVLRAKERYAEALDAFDKAIQLSPDYDEAKVAKGDVEKVIEYLRGES